MGGDTVAERLRACLDEVERVAAAAGRPGGVRLVAVTKTVDADRVLEAYRAGQRLFGENRVQEAREKRTGLISLMPEAEWRLIGHLQSNKVRPAVAEFDAIDSVDSVRLARSIDRHAAEMGRVMAVLIEVNVAGEASKSGFKQDEIRAQFPDLMACRSLRLAGLMTVAPAADDPESIRSVFREMRELRDRIRVTCELSDFTELSMGMSGDFRVAIEEGSTMVRIGRAIFGERPRP